MLHWCWTLGCPLASDSGSDTCGFDDVLNISVNVLFFVDTWDSAGAVACGISGFYGSRIALHAG